MIEAARCPRRNCRGELSISTDGTGHVGYTCAACDLNRAGKCRDCRAPLPTEGNRRNRMRCERCAHRITRERERLRDRERYPVRRAAILAHARNYRAIPEVREKKLKYMAKLRASQRRDDQDRAYGRVYMAVRRQDPAYRDRQNARKRELRRLNPERNAQVNARRREASARKAANHRGIPQKNSGNLHSEAA